MSNILIIEDSKMQQELMLTILREKGYEAEAARDGSRAIKLARGRRYDLILLDIHMPSTNGLVVLSEIRATGASVDSKIVIVSSDDSTATVEIANELGAWDYLVKPFKAEDFLEKVKVWIESSTKPKSVRQSTDPETETAEPDTLEDNKGAGEAMKGISEKRRILVVEDSKVQQELIISVLREKGHEVDAADDGARAIRMATKTKYDLILLDIYMPKTNGLTVLNEIRTAGKSIEAKVVIVSSDNTPVTARTTKLLGACDYIVKPFKADALMEKVESWLE